MDKQTYTHKYNPQNSHTYLTPTPPYTHTLIMFVYLRATFNLGKLGATLEEKSDNPEPLEA